MKKFLTILSILAFTASPSIANSSCDSTCQSAGYSHGHDFGASTCYCEKEFGSITFTMDGTSIGTVTENVAYDPENNFEAVGIFIEKDLGSGTRFLIDSRNQMQFIATRTVTENPPYIVETGSSARARFFTENITPAGISSANAITSANVQGNTLSASFFFSNFVTTINTSTQEQEMNYPFTLVIHEASDRAYVGTFLGHMEGQESDQSFASCIRSATVDQGYNVTSSQNSIIGRILVTQEMTYEVRECRGTAAAYIPSPNIDNPVDCTCVGTESVIAGN